MATWKISAEYSCYLRSTFKIQYGKKFSTMIQQLGSWLLYETVLGFKSRLPTKIHLVKAVVFPVVMYGCESWTIKKLSTKEIILLNCGVGKDSLRASWTARRSNQSILKEINPIHWKDWCWSWNFNTLATWCEELTHWKRPWCWEGLGAGGEGDDRGWDG